MSVSRCNAADITGCRIVAPSVPAHEYTISADPATGTIYASNLGLAQIEAVGSQPYGLAIDQQAGTVYVADTFQAGSMSILDTVRQ